MSRQKVEYQKKSELFCSSNYPVFTHTINRACIVPSAAATECTRVAVGELVEVPRGELGRIAESDLLVSQLLAGASTDLVKSLSAIDNNYLFLVPAVNPGLRFIL